MNHCLNVGVFACGLILGAVFAIPTAFAETKINENICKEMYFRFVELGERKFLEKYKGKSSVYNCIKIYANPDWSFAGKNKIDRNYESLTKLVRGDTDKGANVSITSSRIISEGKFLIKFRACADTTLQKPSFLIKSKTEQYIGVSEKILQNGKCSDYHAQIKAKYREEITIMHVLDPTKHPDIKLGPLRV